MDPFKKRLKNRLKAKKNNGEIATIDEVEERSDSQDRKMESSEKLGK
jgi:hypothetical protein